MKNAEKFKQIFGLYATELWSMPESDFLEWLNRDVETTQIDHTADIGKKAEGDCISRQAAIELCDWYDNPSLHDDLEKLPPVQPDHTADIGKKAEGDCISRQAALEALRKCQTYLFDECDPDKKIELRSAERAIEDLPSVQPEPKWIPCSERLPEYNESVLTWDGYIFCIEKRIPYIRDDDGEPIEGDWWVDDEYDEYESEFYPNLRDGAAIAWMPLPEPYRGGDAE